MKRIIAILLLMALFLCGCNTSAPQETIPPTDAPTEAPTEQIYTYETYFVVNCQDCISMYTAADINSPELCKIPLGAGISYIQAAENGFCSIAYQGLTGYALAANLATEPPVIKEQEYVTYYVVNCNEYITLRAAPSTEADAICKIPLGTSVSYVGAADNGFYKISYMGNTGYALASYLSQDPDAHSQPQDTYYHPNGMYATCYVVNCNESITLRTSPSTSASQYCQIPLGSAVSYIGTSSNGFYKVIYNGQIGYALASYLSFTRPSDYVYGFNTYLQVVNCNESITLRTSPSTSAGEYCQIPLGSYVEFLAVAENGFYLVAYDGIVGYALASYLA